MILELLTLEAVVLVVRALPWRVQLALGGFVLTLLVWPAREARCS